MRSGKASNTALVVAAGLQLLRPCDATLSVLPDEAILRGAQLLRAAHPRLASVLRQAWFGCCCRWLEQATLPGILLHYALRKRALRDYAHTAVAAGCSQVVVLGAGLDTLCMELQARYPELRCIEIDHPATQAMQAIKRRVAGAAGKGIHYLTADLTRQPLAAVLGASTEFWADATTLFVAEGLLMYMPLDAVAALFSQMAAAPPESRLAFTWFEPQAGGLPNFERRSRLVDTWLALRGEPFVSGLRRGGLRRFLADAGFMLEGLSDSIDLLGETQRAALGRKGLPIAGEYLCFARRAPGGQQRG